MCSVAFASSYSYTSFSPFFFFFFFNDTATTEIYTLSLHDALPISPSAWLRGPDRSGRPRAPPSLPRSEEHTSELQSHSDLVCRLLLEKKKKKKKKKKSTKYKKKKNKQNACSSVAQRHHNQHS